MFYHTDFNDYLFLLVRFSGFIVVLAVTCKLDSHEYVLDSSLYIFKLNIPSDLPVIPKMSLKDVWIAL